MRQDIEEPASEFTVRSISVILWRRRLWVLASVVLSVGVFGAAAFLGTPVYRATVVMVPATTEELGMGALGALGALGGLGGLASLAGLGTGGGGLAPEESLAVLRSRNFTEAFILDNALMPELFANRWDPQAQSWKGDPIDHPTAAQAYRYFDRRVRSIVQDRRTGLISLRVDWVDPEKAAIWANELVARLNAEMRARAIRSTMASVDFLQNELSATTVIDTRQAIARLMETQVNKKMLANVTEEYAFRVIDTAMAPEANDPIRPQKAMLIALGGIFGVLLGCLVALVVPRRTTRV